MGVADSNQKKKPGKKARAELTGDDVFKAPVIQREPSSRQAKIGSKVTLQVTATGMPLPSYQWFHNGKKISGATFNRLILTKVRRLNAGAYHCEVKNFVGKATSRVAMLSFMTQRLPQLVVEPKSVRVAEGKPITLRVTSLTKEHLKDYKVLWTFEGKRIRGAQGPELKISEAKMKYAGVYKAMVSTGSSLESSPPVKVEVVAAEAALPEPAPEAPPTEEQLAGLTEAPSVAAPDMAAAAPAPMEDLFFNPDEEAEITPVSAAEAEPAPLAPSLAAQDEVIEELSRSLVFSLQQLDSVKTNHAAEEAAAAQTAPDTRPPVSLALTRKRAFLEKFARAWALHCEDRALDLRPRKRAA